MATIVDVLRPNKIEACFLPRIDSTAKVKIDENEQKDSITFDLRWVGASYRDKKAPNLWISTFKASMSEEQLKVIQWQMTLTPSRLIIWSPYSVGFLGKMQMKTGVASGGHIMYEWLDEIHIGKFSTVHPGVNMLFEANPRDSTYKEQLVQMDFWSVEDANQVLSCLADRLATYWNNNGIDTPELKAEIDKLKLHDWTGPTLELSLLKTGAESKYFPMRDPDVMFLPLSYPKTRDKD